MAVIRAFRRETKGHGTRHGTDVDCVYFDFLDADGSRMLQLSTLGSEHRQSKPKVSQTFQIGAQGAAELRRILDATFPVTGSTGEELDSSTGSTEPEQPTRPPRQAPPVPSWIEDLLDSEVYLEQRSNAGRGPVDNRTVGDVVHALARLGARAPLATIEYEAGLRPGSLRQLLPGLRRLLNVDGYQVLSLHDGVVRLDDDLLRQQFGLRTVPRHAGGHS